MFSGISVAFNSPRDEEMLLCDSFFFAPLKHKYLESSIKKKKKKKKKNLETAEPFFRNLVSLKNKIPATGLF